MSEAISAIMIFDGERKPLEDIELWTNGRAEFTSELSGDRLTVNVATDDLDIFPELCAELADTARAHLAPPN